MSAASALGFLVVVEARARLRTLGRRLRTPRGLLGALALAAWAAYAGAVNSAGLRGFTAREGPIEAAWAAELLLLFTIGLGVLFQWTLFPPGAALGFSEAEAHVLFAAPLRRRALVTYKLVQAALGSLAVVVLLTLVLGRGGIAQRALSAASGWILLLTLTLHGFGVSLTRASLAQHGVSALRRRLVTVAALGAVPVLAGVGFWRAPPRAAFPESFAGALAWTRAVADTAPLAWVLWPARVSLDAVFAGSGRAFWEAAPDALAVLAALAAFVYRSDTAFEEAALESARRLSTRQAAVRAGAVVAVARPGRLRRSFELAARGPPAAALAWKALVRARRVVSIPVIVGAATVIGSSAVASFAARAEGRTTAGGVIAFSAAVFLPIVAFLGPFVYSGDLRRDVPNLDLLRALPLRGRDVLAGEITLPLAQAAVTQWALALLFLALAGEPFPSDLGDRIGIAAAMAIGGPAVSAVLFLAVNGLAVLYPEWVGTPAGASAPLDHLGGRTLVTLATLVIGSFALVPPVVVAVLAAVLAWEALGVWALTLGALAGAALVAIEAAVALRVLGRAFERIDL